MQKEPDPNACSDDTEQIVINIPCRLVERVQKYAKEHGDTITGVVIETLDAILGGRILEVPFRQFESGSKFGFFKGSKCYGDLLDHP